MLSHFKYKQKLTLKSITQLRKYNIFYVQIAAGAYKCCFNLIIMLMIVNMWKLEEKS